MAKRRKALRVNSKPRAIHRGGYGSAGAVNKLLSRSGATQTPLGDGIAGAAQRFSTAGEAGLASGGGGMTDGLLYGRSHPGSSPVIGIPGLGLKRKKKNGT